MARDGLCFLNKIIKVYTKYFNQYFFSNKVRIFILKKKSTQILMFIKKVSTDLI